MRVAVVGCGYWGSKHLRVLRGLENVGEVWACDQNEELLAAAVQLVPGVESCTSFDDVLQRVDAVIIATPPLTHAPLALSALEAGKHVMVEKPLATSSCGAHQLVGAANARGLTLMVGHTFEYNAAVWKLRELIRSGEIGNVYHIDAARLNLGLYQSDVNVIWDLAPHDVSIMNFILASEPTSVHAWAGNHVHTYLEDVAHLRLDYEDINVSAHVRVSWLDPCKVRQVTVAGSKKMVVYDDMRDDERIRVYDKGVAIENIGSPHDANSGVASYRNGGIESPFVDFVEPLRVEDSHFVRCILDGVTPDSDGESGLRVVRVLEAAEQSVLSGATVKIEQHRVLV